MRDPYEILEVGLEATPDEIRKAYRAKAQACHPDKHNGEPAKVIEFQELSDAYQTLIDPHKRALYDDTGAADEDPDSELTNTAIRKLSEVMMSFLNVDGFNPEADLVLAVRMQVEHVRKANVKSIDEARAAIALREKVSKRWRRRSGGRNIFVNSIRRNVINLRLQ